MVANFRKKLLLTVSVYRGRRSPSVRGVSIIYAVTRRVKGDGIRFWRLGWATRGSTEMFWEGKRMERLTRRDSRIRGTGGWKMV